MTIKFFLPTPSNLAAKSQSDCTEQVRARLEDEDEDAIDLKVIPGADKRNIRYKRHFAQPSYSAEDVDIAESTITSTATPLSFIPRAVVSQESTRRRRNARSFEPEPHALRHLIKREDDVEMGGMDETAVVVKGEDKDEDAPVLPAHAEERHRGVVEEPEWLYKETEAGITFYRPKSRRRRHRRRYIQQDVEEEMVEEDGEVEVEIEDMATTLRQHTLGIQVYQRQKRLASFTTFDIRSRPPLHPTLSCHPVFAASRVQLPLFYRQECHHGSRYRLAARASNEMVAGISGMKGLRCY